MPKFLYALAFIFTAYGQHPIVYLISPPRSLSVAFLRVAQGLGFTIFHEPLQSAYVNIHSYELAHAWFRPDAPQSCTEPLNAITLAAQEGPVFVKEMSFAVEEFLDQHDELLKNPQVHFVFLMRNPHHAAISYYNKLPIAQEQEKLITILGYRPLYKIFQHVKQHAINPPSIIFSEDLYLHPEETVRTFCDHVHIPWDPQAMKWSPLGSGFSGVSDWHEIKYPEMTHHWHVEAIQSDGLSKPRTYAVDPTFEESAPEHREAFVEAYRKNKSYYDLLAQEAN